MKARNIGQLQRGVAYALIGAILLLAVGVVSQTARSQDRTETALRSGTQTEPQLRKQNRDRRERLFWEERALGSQAISSEAYDRGLAQWRRLPQASVPAKSNRTLAESDSLMAPLSGAPVSGVKGTTWMPIGPTPLLSDGGATPTKFNGRVNAIALNPNNPNVIYQGSAGGGVWRSIDGGATWTPLTDQQASLGTGKPTALTIDPNNTDIIYVGTSQESELGVNQIMNLSKGILKSTDGGGSWIVLGSGFPAGNLGNATNFYGDDVNAIIVEPSNSSILYLGARSGLYRSTDGGKNWTKGTGTGASGNVRSLSLDTTSPTGNRILYAGISGLGVVQSQNGGQTWASILTAATPVVNTALTATGSIVSVYAALTPPAATPNPAGIQVIYAAFDIAGGIPNPVPIFRSTDQGANWTQVAAAGLSGGGVETYQGYILTMGVDPASPGDGTNDIIYWGALGQFKSVNSGASFSGINAGHADTHSAWTFAPQPGGPSIVLVGDDGGIFKSTDGGATFGGVSGAPDSVNEGGLQTTLFYHLALKNDAAASVSLGALQDLGDIQSTAIPVWTERTGGDGIDVAFDAVNVNEGYGIANTYFGKTFNSGADAFSTAISGGIPAAEFKTFANRVNTDPQNAEVVYFSGSATSLYQSVNGGTSFRNIGNFGAGGPKEVDVAPANSNHVAVSFGAKVFVSTNALAATVGPPSGVTFQNLAGLPGRTVTQVAFDPNDPNVIYATLSGFGGGHVFRTRIGAGGWTDISPALDIPFNALALDGVSVPTTIYAGTDLGVLRSTDGGASWATLDDIHFPNVPVTELKINSLAGVLQVATFGRGVFEFALPDGPVIAVNAENGLDFGSVCAGSTRCLTLQVYNVGTADLIVNGVQRLMGSSAFRVQPYPSTPVLISPNSEVDFTVCYTPSPAATNEQATIRIASNDPDAPYYDLTATGAGAVPSIATAIANGGNFGDVCIGTYKDLDLTINNRGDCELKIFNITSSSPEFSAPTVSPFPLVVQAGTSTHVPIRLQPTTLGVKSANISIASDDPKTPLKVVPVSGNTPPGRLRLTGSTAFGDVCAGTLAEKQLAVCNVGACNLNVSSVAFVDSCPDFTLINNPFPAAVSPDSCQNVTIRFTPTSCGPKSCTLRIVTDDPNALTNIVTVTANTPCASIDVPPDQCFPPTVIQSVGACVSLQPFPISNTGTCPLKITAITLGGANPGAYLLSGLPSFPIILEQGHVAGEGNFQIGFAPVALARDTLATVSVTYEDDPVSHHTTTVTRTLNGEGVRTGARVLVLGNGVPLATVEKIMIQRITGNRNKPLLNTVDNAMNLPLTAVTPAAPCGPFQYHREYSTISNPIQLLPGSYQITATGYVGKKKFTKAIGFDVNTCTFNPNIVISLP